MVLVLTHRRALHIAEFVLEDGLFDGTSAQVTGRRVVGSHKAERLVDHSRRVMVLQNCVKVLSSINKKLNVVFIFLVFKFFIN